MASEINNDPHIGLEDIKLDSGKVVTEARYCFDILEDSVQNIEPEITITNTITKQKLPSLVPAIDPCPTDEFSDDNVMYFAEPIHVSNRDSILPKQSSKNKKRQFVTIPEDSIDAFVLDQENKNTARKTQSDIQSLQQFLVTKLETREIYTIPPHELNQILCQFLISVRKDDGDKYEPASLKGMLCSFDRGVTEHHQMIWGDVKILRDNSSGLEFLQMNERNTKTRTDKSLRDQRDIPQMPWANPENELKCPVHAYKLYRSKRQLKFSNPTDPFYIQENTNREKSGLWYKSQPIGINKLGKFMNKMASAAGIIQSKEDQHDDNDGSENDSVNRRLTNHSARRFMLQKLDDAGFEHNHTKQISGHKNIQSISTYSKLNSKKHHEISRTILADKNENMQSSQSTRTVTINNNPVGQNEFQNVQKTAVSENQVSFGNLAAAPKAAGLSYLFGGPIYGGTFNINISNLPSLSPSPQTTKRRRYVIESDSSQE
ncbi:unnamed protein product [Mytilus coruscus]|uniref:ZMYM2-like/QRICH1 C-terminal domain-containing protein n=1 Tax=Mytilus coruscus TaxID=42192 RepID=A0A6J8EF97_MYTCO|nr:unnamed protein product [Mytilus coruscus]